MNTHVVVTLSVTDCERESSWLIRVFLSQAWFQTRFYRVYFCNSSSVSLITVLWLFLFSGVKNRNKM